MKCETTLALYAFSHVVLAVPHFLHEATLELAESNSALSARADEHFTINARAQAAEDLTRDETPSFSSIENQPNNNDPKIPINRRAPTETASSAGLFRGPSINFQNTRPNRNDNKSKQENESDSDDDDDDDDDEEDDEDDERDRKKNNKKAKPGFFQRIKNFFRIGRKNED